MKRLLQHTLLALIAATSFACDEAAVSECPGGTLAMVVQVTDGDTVKVSTLAEKVRLLGIEAPETNFTNASDCPAVWEEMSLEDQSSYNETCCYGDQSKEMLQFLLPQGIDICLVNPNGGDLEKGVYGRYLADIYLLDGTWINGKQVAGGYARANSGFPHPTRSEELKGLEGLGALNGAGLWGYCSVAEEGEGPCE
jgi:endonuclease YncB( thermonuclease family)